MGTQVNAQQWVDVFSDFDGSVTSFGYYEDKLVITPGYYNERLITWDGGQIDTIPFGINVPPQAFLEKDGKLYVGGNFSEILDIPYSERLAVWDGNQWENMLSSWSAGATDEIKAFAEYQGELYVAGNFHQIDGVAARNIAKWNGVDFEAVGDGLYGGIPEVRTLAVFHDKLYAAGRFTGNADTTAYNIASWDGNKWSPLLSGVGGNVYYLYTDTVSNKLIVGGSFTNASGIATSAIATWDGQSWDTLGSGVNFVVFSIIRHEGYIYAGGISANSLPTDTCFARWNGQTWEPILGFDSNVNSLASYNGNLFVGGSFSQSPAGPNSQWIACYGNNCPVGVGMKESKIEKEWFEIYPNPASRILKIEWQNTKRAQLKLYNQVGELVLSKSSVNTQGVELDVSQLSNGLYFLHIIQSNRKAVAKVVVQQ